MKELYASIDSINDENKPSIIKTHFDIESNETVAEYQFRKPTLEEFNQDLVKVAKYYGVFLPKPKSFIKRLWDSFWDAVAINL